MSSICHTEFLKELLVQISPVVQETLRLMFPTIYDLHHIFLLILLKSFLKTGLSEFFTKPLRLHQIFKLQLKSQFGKTFYICVV